jgi:hypothetical protein
MIPKIMLEGGHAWVHERPIAAAASSLLRQKDRKRQSVALSWGQLLPRDQGPASSPCPSPRTLQLPPHSGAAFRRALLARARALQPTGPCAPHGERGASQCANSNMSTYVSGGTWVSTKAGGPPCCSQQPKPSTPMRTAADVRGHGCLQAMCAAGVVGTRSPSSSISSGRS